MILLPLALARAIVRRTRAGWGVFAIGAVTFVASQVGHIPFNQVVLPGLKAAIEPYSSAGQLIMVALFLGLSAGVFEEGARYLTYRFWATEARTWSKGLMMGAGHGGIEAILLGLIVAANMGFFFAYRNGIELVPIPADARSLLEAQIEAAFAAPWYDTLLGAVERVFALSTHLALSLMVMRVFTARPGQLRHAWLGAAVGWHALANAMAVFAVQTWNAYITELLLAVVAALSWLFIWKVKQPEATEAPEPLPLPQAGPVQPVPVEVTAESLEESRYHS